MAKPVPRLRTLNCTQACTTEHHSFIRSSFCRLTKQSKFQGKTALHLYVADQKLSKSTKLVVLRNFCNLYTKRHHISEDSPVGSHLPESLSYHRVRLRLCNALLRDGLKN
jgi:hypothetical protein